MPHVPVTNSKTKTLFFFLAAFFSVWAVLRAGALSTRSILAPVLFACFILFFRVAQERFGSVKRIWLVSGILSLLFSLLFLLAKAPALTGDLSSGLFRFMILTACGIGLFFIFYFSIGLLFYAGANASLSRNYAAWNCLPYLSFLLCLLFWLPYFLYEFPGIMTPDSINQFEQVLHLVPYSNHHPWVHTLLIGFFYSIGRFFTTDVSTALAFFTVFQLCFMAFSIAFLIDTLQRFRVRLFYCLLVLSFYVLIPYHAVFAVTIWKDVLFSAGVLLFTLSLLRILFLHGHRDSGRISRIVTLIIYMISGLMFCLFRTNGWYAFLVSLPFLIYAFRRQLKLMLPLHLLLLAIVLLIKGPVMNHYQVTQPDFVESVCIPLQQVSKVIVEDRYLTEEEWSLIHNVMDTTYIKELYAPGFADNMKELVRAGNPDYLAAHKGAYGRLWLTLMFRYPGDYLSAYVDQTIGYWFPDVAYPVADTDGVIVNDAGVISRPLIGGPLVVKSKEIFLKLGEMIPLYGLLFSMGAMFWGLLLCIGLIVVRREYRKLILFLPGFAVILTLLAATPVSTEFRYAYSLILCMPVYVIVCFLKQETAEA